MKFLSIFKTVYKLFLADKDIKIKIKGKEVTINLPDSTEFDLVVGAIVEATKKKEGK